MLPQCAAYARGNTDLAWTRLTRWRALLAAALDQHPLKVRSATVAAERISPSADLLVAWLHDRLKVTVTRIVSDGPGITEVVLATGEGDIRVPRPSGGLATFSSPGRPDRPVALPRRSLPELLGEELRRLDEDEVYAADRAATRDDRGALQERRRGSRSTPTPTTSPAPSPPRCSSGWQRAVRRRRTPDRADRRHHRPRAAPASWPTSRPSSGVDWSRVVIWWGDERFVAPDSADRNAAQAREAFLDAVGADPANVHEMPSTADCRLRRRGRRGVQPGAPRARLRSSSRW